MPSQYNESQNSNGCKEARLGGYKGPLVLLLCIAKTSLFNLLAQDT